MGIYSRHRVQGPTLLYNFQIGKSWVYNQASVPLYYPGPGLTRLERKTDCYDSVHPGPPYRTGGAFWLTRQDIPYTEAASGAWNVGNYHYAGAFCWDKPGNLNTELASISSESAAGFGATGWNRFRPVKPKASLGQFIAELRDFPSMFKWRLKRFKDLGSSYLNYKFGWLPFIHDLIKWYETATKIERYIDFTRRNNGKWLRRGGIIRDETSTTVSTIGNQIVPQISSVFYPGYVLSQCKLTRTVTDKIWFDSAMKYYIPSLDCDRAEDVFSSELLRKLYGLEITPALLWELLPYSWLLDWFGNIGDIISNFSNSMYDNLVAKYAYVMRHRKIELKYEQDQPMNGGAALRLRATCFVENKERAEASPFGFGIEWPDFSASQLAILAALGISRWRY